MLDINLIRKDPDFVKAQLARGGMDAPIDEILELDARRRAILGEVETLRRERNVVSKQIGRWIGSAKKLEKQLGKMDPDSAEAQAARAELAELNAQADATKASAGAIGDKIDTLDEELRTVETRFREQQLWVPNLPHPTTPDGPDESHNVFHEPEGAPLPTFDFEPKPHWDLGPELDIIDFERGVKLSGSRFYLLKGWGARLQRALIQFMLDMHIFDHGYTEIYLPLMVRSKVFEGAGQLPKLFDNIYRDAEEDFMFLGTAEIALTNLFADEILAEEQLPIKLVAHTACFRREKMSAGKDVRGIKRGHQFDKVEMYQFVHPDTSYDVLEQLKQHALDVVTALDLPYRIVDLAAGDVSFAMTKTYDIEVWAAGCNEWLEVSSISNSEDFQARRANVKYRPKEGGKLQYPHTLNASGLALPRIVIAILENNQQADGSVIIPEPLRPYMRGLERIEP